MSEAPEAPVQDALEESLRQVLRAASASAKAGIQVQARPALKRPSSASQVHSEPKASRAQREGRKKRGGKKAGCGWKKAMLKVPQYQIRMYARCSFPYRATKQEERRAWREEASEHRRRVTALLLLQLHKCPTLILCSSSAMASGAEHWLAGRATYPVSFHILGSTASASLAGTVRLVIVYDDFCEAAALMRILHSLRSAATVYHLTLRNNRCGNTHVPLVSRLQYMGLIVPKVSREALLCLAWMDHAAAKALLTASPSTFQRAPQAVRSDHALALTAVRASAHNLFFTAAELADDEEMVCTAVAVADLRIKRLFIMQNRFGERFGQDARQRILQGAEHLQMQALESGVRISDEEAIGKYAIGKLPQRIVCLSPTCWQPLTLGCVNLAGDELASISLETSGLDTAEALRGHIASTLDWPKVQLRVLLPSKSELPQFGPLDYSMFGTDGETASMADTSCNTTNMADTSCGAS